MTTPHTKRMRRITRQHLAKTRFDRPVAAVEPPQFKEQERLKIEEMKQAFFDRGSTVYRGWRKEL